MGARNGAESICLEQTAEGRRVQVTFAKFSISAIGAKIIW